MIQLSLSQKIPPEIDLKKEDMEKILDEFYGVFNLTGDLEVEIIFTSEEEIKKLNQKNRQIDAPTDVLSFPQSPIPGQNTQILGSIVIFPQKVTEKNETFSDVIKHGMLHLVGYDHETDETTWEEAAQKINCSL